MVRRRLQVLLASLGVVAAVAGADGVRRGTGGVHAGGSATVNVDSEFRFFAAWYATAGVLLLDAARAPEQATTTVRAACGGLLTGAVGRALSMRRLGLPSPLFRVLMGVEVGLPCLVLAWHRRAIRQLDQPLTVIAEPGLR